MHKCTGKFSVPSVPSPSELRQEGDRGQGLFCKEVQTWEYAPRYSNQTPTPLSLCATKNVCSPCCSVINASF